MAISKKQENKVIDPVCGMAVNTKDCFLSSSYKGIDYFFCSERCKTLFDEDQGAFIDMKAAREDVIEQERAGYPDHHNS